MILWLGKAGLDGDVMFRAFVLLLMLPSMLLPQGMCFCQVVEIRKPPADSRPTSPDRKTTFAHGTTTRPDCACDSCRLRPVSSAPAEGDDHPTHNPSDPGPSKHWPGCPAELGCTPLTLLVPAVVVQADLVANDACLSPLSWAVVSPTRVASFPTRAISPPLFISHCTLRI
jgi:hypothetical protein